jgi:hypothetical protein
MKSLILATLLALCGVAQAQTQIDLPTVNNIVLDTPVHTPVCYADNVTVSVYSTAVTGFSSDGNFVNGQATAHFTCGHSGRGANIHTYYSCASLVWDLAGNLVSATDTNVVDANNLPVSSSCPDLGLVLPSRTPPSSPVVGNEFTNAGGYIAETIVSQPCGAIACYGLPLDFPVLITP